MPPTRIFLSTVSSRFRACRDALASDLRAIGCEVRVQEDFQQGPRTLIEQIEAYVAGSDRVIAVVGDAYGFEATGVPVPGGGPPRSYSQWEYCFALGERLYGTRAAPRDLHVYFPSERFPGGEVTETPELQERQRAFVAMVKASGKHWGSFHSVEDLCRLVLRDGWRIGERPRRPQNLPFGTLGKRFSGRGRALEELHERLRRPEARATAIVSPQAIHGLGGVGKTTLAVEYALRNEAEYAARLFVTADSPEALRRNLAALCAAGVLDLPEREAREDEVRTAAALRWLHEHEGWLLILDNVDTPEAAAAIEATVGPLTGGHVLVTARVSAWSAAVETLEIDVLGEEDAARFLLERTAGRRPTRDTDGDDARALARALGGLAVALEQAGAYVSTRRTSLVEYLRRWSERDAAVREFHDERLSRYPRAALVTWDTTFDQLDAPAQSLLRLLCWFGPEPIPRMALEAAGVREVLAADPAEALAGLAAFSLIKWEADSEALRVHRLVQEVTRERLPPEAQRQWQEAALAAVNVALPGDPPPLDVRSWPRWEPLRPHVAVLIAAADEAGIAEPTTRLMNELGLLLETKGLWREAEPLMRRALGIDEKTHGLDHPSVATYLNNLASLLWDTNRLGEAEPLMRRALGIDEKSQGSNHPDVAVKLNNLASLLLDTNRLGEAEPLMRRALGIDEKAYGPDHPRVAIDLNNLAQLLKATNRLGEAEPLMRRALGIDEKAYGLDHPKVAIRLNNLASLLSVTNRLGEAEPLMRRALGTDEKSYGPDHPNVAIRLNNLARLLRATNRLAEAAPLMERSLQILLRTTAGTGHHHPHVRVAAANYHDLLIAAGRAPDDAAAEVEALARSYDVEL